MKKNRILFLCQYFYPEYISSATLPLDTALALNKHGYKVEVLTGYPQEYNKSGKVSLKEEYKGLIINRVKYFQTKRGNFFGRIINFFSFTLMVLLKLPKFKKFDTIIVYSSPPVLPIIAVMSKKIFNNKIVFVCYDVYPEIAQVTNVTAENSIISKVMKLINNTLFKNVDKVIALSKEMKNVLVKNRPHITKDQVEIIPNWYEDKGINPKRSEISSKSMFYEIAQSNDLVVSYFGNMGTAQDISTILKAIKKLNHEKNICFLFAGHGNKLSEVKQTVSTEGLSNVRVFDFLHGKEFEDALICSDCFIVSLEKGVSGLAVPSKTYSYMMSGKPVIAIMDKDCDISKDLIYNNAGYSVDVGNEDTLVKAIKDLKDNPDKRLEMGRNVRNVYLKKYTTEACTKKYIKLMIDINGG